MRSMTRSWRGGWRIAKRRWKWRGGSAAQGADDFLHVAGLVDLQAEVFADLDGVAEADGFVVDQELEGLVAGLDELDDRAWAEAHDLGGGQLALGELDDDGDGQLHDPPELGGGGGGGVGGAED